MRVGLVASPFIEVPPPRYGGTELFIRDLAVNLRRPGVEVVVYTVGSSTVPGEKRFLYAKSRWPLVGNTGERLRELRHSAWALEDAKRNCDLIHVNDAVALAVASLVDKPLVVTLHHPLESEYLDFYRGYPQAQFVAISRSQARHFHLPGIRVIHHGIDLGQYRFRARKQPYLSFLGRLVPVKGAHLAIRVAQRAGMPLKIAGEIQPPFRDYFEREIEPHLDGKSVEYIGEADLAGKNELLGNSSAMLFPVLWEEPFGLAAVEAMACGTPVVALRGGAATETIAHGLSGYLCRSLSELVSYTRRACKELNPKEVRRHVEQNFSAQRMAEDYLNLYRQVLRRRTRPAEPHPIAEAA